MAPRRPTRWHWLDWFVSDALAVIAILAVAALIADIMIGGAR